MLVYLAREWSDLQAKELGQCLQRDPSMSSRLYALYAANLDEESEVRLSRAMDRTKIKSIRMPDPLTTYTRPTTGET